MRPGLAAGTGRLHAKETVEIAAPPAKVWTIIHNFPDLTWVPPVKSSTATNGNKPGSVRTLDLGGPQLKEQLVRYNAANHSYTYRITADPANVKVLPVRDYLSTISVKPGANHGSTVVWQGSFNRADPSANPAPEGNDAAAEKAITGVYRAGLDNLKTKAEGGAG